MAVTDQQEITYNSVVLAALLHDVGKLLHRGKSGYDGKHEVASGDFLIHDGEPNGKLNKNPLYDLKLVEWLVRLHHAKKGEKKEDALQTYFKSKEARQDLDQNTLWNLLKIVRAADSYSCAERIYEEQKRTDAEPRTAPLDSIFSSVSISAKSKARVCRYALSPLNPLQSFPEQISSLEALQDHITDFKKHFPDLVGYNDFDRLLTVLADYLEKYTWCVPSDTRYRRADISLFDHLRSSAAIAVCLYKNHVHELKSETFKTRRNELVLVAGGFSGIQDYIFDITGRGSGGAAKRLRARSLFIQVLCEAAIHKILHAVDLPLICNLFSAGGKFILLLPRTDGISDQLRMAKSAIEHEIHRRYFNQFSFLMTYCDIEKYRPCMDVGNFCAIADEMFHLLEAEKTQPFRSVFYSNEDDDDGNEKKRQWNPTAFRLTDDQFRKYAESGDCTICGRGPGEISERSGTDENLLTIPICTVCHTNKQIGEILPKRNVIAFGKAKGVNETSERVVLFSENNGNDAYYIDLCEDLRSSDAYYLIWDIGNQEKGERSTQAIIDKRIANHVCIGPKNTVMSFEELSSYSRWTKEENGKHKRYGSDFLGVLKADADNLGLVFSRGFGPLPSPGQDEKSTKAESNIQPQDTRSVSRFLTLSRMLELFFSGWVKDVMEKDPVEMKRSILDALPGNDVERFSKYLESGVIDFSKIYTVYSGGDDMVLIGPWETMILFSVFLNAKFRQYTCESDSFTLSAGLVIVKPKYPIAMAIRDADALLERSKREGKNRFTLFGTTVEWAKFPELIDFFLFLDGRLQSDSSNINPAFLYRLLHYHKMAVDYIDDAQIEALKFVSALNYDIGRNIAKEKKGQTKHAINEDMRQVHRLTNIQDRKDSLIYQIRPALFWALYRNRGICLNGNIDDI